MISFIRITPGYKLFNILKIPLCISWSYNSILISNIGLCMQSWCGLLWRWCYSIWICRRISISKWLVIKRCWKQTQVSIFSLLILNLNKLIFLVPLSYPKYLYLSLMRLFEKSTTLIFEVFISILFILYFSNLYLKARPKPIV